MSHVVTLVGGLRGGERFEVELLTPTVKVPGAYEDSKVEWREDHFVRLFPLEVYKRDSGNPGSYVYSHIEPASKEEG